MLSHWARLPEKDRTLQYSSTRVICRPKSSTAPNGLGQGREWQAVARVLESFTQFASKIKADVSICFSIQDAGCSEQNRRSVSRIGYRLEQSQGDPTRQKHHGLRILRISKTPENLFIEDLIEIRHGQESFAEPVGFAFEAIGREPVKKGSDYRFAHVHPVLVAGEE